MIVVEQASEWSGSLSRTLRRITATIRSEFSDSTLLVIAHRL